MGFFFIACFAFIITHSPLLTMNVKGNFLRIENLINRKSLGLSVVKNVLICCVESDSKKVGIRDLRRRVFNL